MMLSSYQNISLNESKVLEYEEYYSKYFNHSLIKGYGTEIILALLKDINIDTNSCKWIDLGAGSMSLFWSIGMNKYDEVWLVDLFPEAFSFLEKLSKSKFFPPCYYQALDLLGRDSGCLNDFFKKLVNIDFFDVFIPWPNIYSEFKFDIITQIGLFGLCANETEYIKVLQETLSHLNSQGFLLGANWKYKKIKGKQSKENDYLREEILDKAVPEKYKVVYNKYHTFNNDPDFDGVLIWKIRYDG